MPEMHLMMLTSPSTVDGVAAPYALHASTSSPQTGQHALQNVRRSCVHSHGSPQTEQ